MAIEKKENMKKCIKSSVNDANGYKQWLWELQRSVCDSKSIDGG